MLASHLVRVPVPVRQEFLHEPNETGPHKTAFHIWAARKVGQEQKRSKKVCG